MFRPTVWMSNLKINDDFTLCFIIRCQLILEYFIIVVVVVVSRGK